MQFFAGEFKMAHSEMLVIKRGYDFQNGCHNRREILILECNASALRGATAPSAT
jgi:hypothetical protein